MAERMAYHNQEPRHSGLGYQASAAYLVTQWLRHAHNSKAVKVSKRRGALPTFTSILS